MSDCKSDPYENDQKSWASSWAPVLDEYPDLGKVVELWQKLPDVMRKGIVGMAVSACQEE